MSKRVYRIKSGKLRPKNRYRNPVKLRRKKGKAGLAKVGIWGSILLTLPKVAVLLKATKFGKIIFSLGSFLTSMGAYIFIYPWQFAFGLMVLMVVHEWGHILAAREKKIPTSLPMFIPFMGALISLKKNPQDAATEAYVATGGPLVGGAFAVLLHFMGLLLDSRMILLIALTGYGLNLFNLLPLGMLDGGRIVKAISLWLRVPGILLAVAVIVWTKSWFLGFILLISLIEYGGEFWGMLKDPQYADTKNRYYRVSSKERLTYSLVYSLLIIGFIGLGAMVIVRLKGIQYIFG